MMVEQEIATSQMVLFAVKVLILLSQPMTAMSSSSQIQFSSAPTAAQ